jgi:hypothetical protein
LLLGVSERSRADAFAESALGNYANSEAIAANNTTLPGSKLLAGVLTMKVVKDLSESGFNYYG